MTSPGAEPNIWLWKAPDKKLIIIKKPDQSGKATLGGKPRKVLFVEAPRRCPNIYPFIYHFD